MVSEGRKFLDLLNSRPNTFLPLVFHLYSTYNKKKYLLRGKNDNTCYHSPNTSYT
jgi:hypothetical protein